MPIETSAGRLEQAATAAWCELCGARYDFCPVLHAYAFQVLAVFGAFANLRRAKYFCPFCASDTWHTADKSRMRRPPATETE